ncbi:MAG: two-component system response regulator [Rhodocyclales bacterium RIFCSPLOWO2_02_FULL_63_24]|nr:MAG: two-component system response regulator [Rhodocyclales bacterium RIFCSPLOWO2_02_FULL_63_24]
MAMEKLILLVDDDPALLGVLKQCLRPHYQVRIATLGAKGLELARMQPMPDLILLDVKLPDMHGYEICTALKRDVRTAAIPVMFLSSHSDVEHITLGLELGAVDYVSKPVVAPILMARVRTHMRLREAGDLLRDQNAHLEQLVSKRTSDLEAKTTELQHNQDLTILALGSIAETRDNETGNHIHRTRAYVQVMSRRLAPTQRYRNTVSEEQWTMIWKSAPLHDIGKVGIPDHILLKPGKLSVEEFEVMKRHPVIGRDALRAAEIRMGAEGSFLSAAKEIAYAHHERWDGSGYPQGLGGEAIPLSARLMALADVYDALISKRVYKPPLPHAVAVEAIREGRGSQFDPSIVDCFLEDADEFRYIASRFSDDTEPQG